MINLPINNPYSRGVVYALNEKEVSLESLPTRYKPLPDDKVHEVISGERLWDLAFKFYGTARWWWLIYKINEDKIDDPFELTEGIYLLIPNINAFEVQNQ